MVVDFILIKEYIDYGEDRYLDDPDGAIHTLSNRIMII